jgi:hypothetical protein
MCHQNCHQIIGGLGWLLVAIQLNSDGGLNVRGTNDFRDSSLATWTDLLEGLFPTGIPESAKWTDVATMSSILDDVGSQSNSNHMFYPTGGGNDLRGAFPFDEESGCLALKTGERSAQVVKPSALLFESFGAELEWAYFRLECQPLSYSGVYEGEQKGANEEVVLVYPGIYAPRSAWDEDEYQGEPLPRTAELIDRSVGGGPFVIFAKGSAYNLSSGRGSDTYGCAACPDECR